MGRLAVCGGSAVRGLDLLLPDVVYLQRHGADRYVLPHRIDHVANMRSLAEAGWLLAGRAANREAVAQALERLAPALA